MPLKDELSSLEIQLNNASTLDALKPIYDRLDEIARGHPHDFEIQLITADLRDQLVQRGVTLRRQASPSTAAASVVPAKHWSDIPPAPSAAAASGAMSWIRHDDGRVNIRRALAIGAGLGIVAWLVLFVGLVQLARVRNLPQPAAGTAAAASVAPPAAGTVPVDIITTPPGAAIQINNDTKCTSNCRVNLAPGNYQVTAMLDGFDPAATGVTVAPGALINVTLALQNTAQTVRIFTDLASGHVLLDGRPAPDLQDGQLILERVKNGRHDLVVSGPNVEARFAFELVAGKAPVLVGPVVASNLLTVIVGSIGADAHLQSSAPQLKVSLDGQPRGEAGAQGLDLHGIAAGDHQLVLGEGAEQRKMVLSFGPRPELTAYLKSDVNSGTLVVSTGEDGVSVFLDGREYRRKTLRGQLRIPALGPVHVRVEKTGFQPEQEQTAEVKKGEETRIAFRMRPLPQVASLSIKGAPANSLVFIDDHNVGRVSADGTLSAANIAPGDHAVELRHDGFVPKRSTRSFRAGETLSLAGADVVMAAVSGTIHLILTPADAQVLYRRAEDQQWKSASAATLKLDPGNYVFIAKAANHLDRTERVPVVAGETRNVELALAREKAPPPPAVKPATTPVAQDWSGWLNQNGEHVRKGGNRIAVRTGPLNGTITFTAQLRKGGNLFRGGKLRWFLDDGSNVAQFEIDKKHFYSKGEDLSGKFPHEEVDEKRFTVQIEITPDRIVQRLMVGDKWVTLGSQPGRAIPNGKFGFVIPGGDEVAVSDFRFSGR